ncbi:antitoxin [Phytohabitans flavus]|nr:antitoxin [Phytohabitans flavus]
MGIADSFKNKAEQAIDKVDGERVKKGVEKAGDKIDEKTGGKYSGQVDKAQDAASGYIDKMDGKSNR